jgi:hypothetical protein
MNQLAVAGIGAVVIAAGAFGAGWRVNSWRHDSQKLAIEQAAEKAGHAATTAATDVIKGLRPQFTTINRGVERETRTEIRYTECRHTPATWGLLDSAYQAAGGEPFGDRAGVPAPAPAE